MHIRELDLNLLVTLDALLMEHNVTRAAKRLHLSQPAVSHALARLREAFGDPLLVRGQHGMTPTPVAMSLREPLRRTLDELEQALATSRGFDPSKSTLTFKLGVIDYVSVILLPAVTRLLREQAPFMKIVAVQPSSADEAADGLATGALDLAIGMMFTPPPRARRRVLFRDTLCCMTNADRPGGHTLTLSDYIAADHLSVSPSGRTHPLFDDELRKLGLHRNEAMCVPHFSAAVAIAAKTDLLLTAPRRLAQLLAPAMPLKMLDLPFCMPVLEVSQIWHDRTHTDPAQRWVRAMIAAAAASELAQEAPSTDAP